MNGRVEQLKDDTKKILDNCDSVVVLSAKDIHQDHIDNPSQYDKDGKFIVGSGEICPSCGTEWEDHLAVITCPCLDEDYRL